MLLRARLGLRPIQPPVSTRILGKTTRDAVRNKERCKGRRAPTQDPSTNNLLSGWDDARGARATWRATIGGGPAWTKDATGARDAGGEVRAWRRARARRVLRLQPFAVGTRDRVGHWLTAVWPFGAAARAARAGARAGAHGLWLADGDSLRRLRARERSFERVATARRGSARAVQSPGILVLLRQKKNLLPLSPARLPRGFLG